jgi:hypothetical protein
MFRVKPVIAALSVVAFAVFFTVPGRAYSPYGKWGSNSVLFYMNPQNGDLGADAAEAAFRYAMNVWNTEGSSAFSYNYGGRVGDTATGYDRRNVAIFRPDGDGSEIARTYSWSSGGTIVDADIVFFDGAFTFFAGNDGCVSSPSYGVYVEDVATHELGHALGLLHSAVSTATMVSGYAACTQDKRSLDEDDVAGVQSLYGAGSNNSPTSTPPSVAIASPSNNASFQQGTSVSFSGSASDNEDGSLSSNMVWTSSIDGVLGYGPSFTRSLSPGGHVVTASATDSTGLTSSKQITVNITASVNTAPSVSISSPTSTSYKDTTNISFSGSSSDTQDGNLTSRIVWTSSLLGEIGVGGSFSRTLSAGIHVITASVTDNAGATSSRQVTVSVTTAVLSSTLQPTLSASGYKIKGSQRVDLTWSGLTAASADIYRDGTKVTTTPNDGMWTDILNRKGGGAYRYKVCGTGTTSCSDEVQVTF